MSSARAESSSQRRQGSRLTVVVGGQAKTALKAKRQSRTKKPVQFSSLIGAPYLWAKVWVHENFPAKADPSAVLALQTPSSPRLLRLALQRRCVLFRIPGSAELGDQQCSLTGCQQGWADHYEVDKVSATADLLSLLVQVGHFPCQIS